MNNKTTNKTLNTDFIIFFLLPCLIQIILSSIYVHDAAKDYASYLEELRQIGGNYNPLIPLNSVFTYWIGGGGIDRAGSAFYYLMFFGAVLPCIYIIHRYKKTPEQKAQDRFSSYACVFAVSGLFAFIPLLINFISTLMFIPVIKPDPVYDIYFDVLKGDAFSDIFYSFPFAYIFIYILILSAMCGAIGCLGYASYKLFNDNIIALLLPEILLLILHFVDKHYYFRHSISPLIYCSSSAEMMQKPIRFIAELGSTVALAMILYFIGRIKVSAKKKGAKT